MSAKKKPGINRESTKPKNKAVKPNRPPRALSSDSKGNLLAKKALRESENIFKFLFEHSAIGISITLPSGEFNLNRAMCKILGYTQKELNNRNWQEITHPEDVEITQAMIDALLSGEKKSVRFSKRYFHKKGSIIWADLSSTLRRDKDGKPIYMITTIIDITERMRVEEALRESEERFSRLSAASSEGIVITENGIILDVNPQLSNMLGCKAPDLIGTSAMNFVAPESRDLVVANMRAGNNGPYEHLARKKDGSIFPVEIHARMIPYKGRQTRVTVINDISERRAAEEQLRYQAALLTNLNDAIIASDSQFRMTAFNSAAESLYGWKAEEILGQNGPKIFQTEWPSVEAEEMRRKISEMGQWRGEATQRRKDGTRFPVEISTIVVRGDKGQITDYISVNRDISERKRSEKMLQARLRLFEFASRSTLEEVLVKTLDETCLMLDSSIGFYHIVDADEQTLTLQAWSTRTTKDFCIPSSKGEHYPINQAGVWVDCIHERKAIIHNDYASLPHRKGLPEGHAPVQRELLVPILRKGKVVSVLGIGNKATEYTQEDIEIATYFADAAWEITERKRVEEALVDTSKHLSNMMKSSPAIIYSLRVENDQAIPIWISDNIRSIMGFSPESPLEPDWWMEHVHLQDRLAARLSLEHLFDDEYHHEYRFQCKDGHFIWLYDEHRLLRDADHKPREIIGTWTDISEPKKIEEEIRKLNTELEQRVEERTHDLREAQEKILRQEKLAVLGQLAGSMGHELRNPLGIINNSIYYLKFMQPEASEKIKQHHAMIEQEVITAEKIIADLLDFARMEAMKQEPVSVRELVEGTLVRFPVPEPIQLTLKLSDRLPNIFADQRQMEQVLGNLIINACQAMDVKSAATGSKEGGKLIISASRQKQTVAIAVEDTGSGIAPEFIKLLFEPLFTTKAKGIGLGLAISKKLVEANGGRIEVQSVPGKGSTFTLVLPVERGNQ